MRAGERRKGRAEEAIDTTSSPVQPYHLTTLLYDLTTLQPYNLNHGKKNPSDGLRHPRGPDSL
jgi:hypothetical protein